MKIPNIRLLNQQLLSPLFTQPKELVSWMGAMQAQNYSMVKWAAVICGLLVRPICYFGVKLIKGKLKIDDALDAFGCHGIGGIWGGIAPNDVIIAMQTASMVEAVLLVSSNGLGKRTRIDEFTTQNRGGKGVKCYKITEKRW